MLTWQEAVDRAIQAVQQAEAEALAKRSYDADLAQTYAQISFAWSNIGMMLEAQEAAEDAAA